MGGKEGRLELRFQGRCHHLITAKGIEDHVQEDELWNYLPGGSQQQERPSQIKRQHRSSMDRAGAGENTSSGCFMAAGTSSMSRS